MSPFVLGLTSPTLIPIVFPARIFVLVDYRLEVFCYDFEHFPDVVLISGLIYVLPDYHVVFRLWEGDFHLGHAIVLSLLRTNPPGFHALMLQ